MPDRFSLKGPVVLALLILLGVAIACTASLADDPSPAADGDTPTAEMPATSDWVSVAAGVDYRAFAVTTASSPDFEMHVVRIDPEQVQFRVHYLPGDGNSFFAWQAALGQEVLVFVNASFFTEDNNAIGLVVADGVTYGISLAGYGGMFQVEQSGTVRVRSLVQEPYRGEFYAQAVQAFPVLVERPGIAAATGPGFDDPARRTLVAEDGQGNILLMTTGLLGHITFNELQDWLLGSGLELDVAVALDGGKSTAMYVTHPNEPVEIPAFSDLPIILAVYPR